MLIMLLFEEEEASPEVQMATRLLRLCYGKRGAAGGVCCRGGGGGVRSRRGGGFTFWGI